MKKRKARKTPKIHTELKGKQLRAAKSPDIHTQVNPDISSNTNNALLDHT